MSLSMLANGLRQQARSADVILSRSYCAARKLICRHHSAQAATTAVLQPTPYPELTVGALTLSGWCLNYIDIEDNDSIFACYGQVMRCDLSCECPNRIGPCGSHSPCSTQPLRVHVYNISKCIVSSCGEFCLFITQCSLRILHTSVFQCRKRACAPSWFSENNRQVF
jgi:hypothetical protein